MKKNIAIYIALITILTVGVFVLSGCQNNEESANTNGNTANNNTNSTETSLRNQLVDNIQNTEIENTNTATKLEDLEKYNKVEKEGFTTYKDSEGLSFLLPDKWMSIGTEAEPVYMSTDGKGAMVTVAKDVMSEDTTVVTNFDAYMSYQKLFLMQQMTMLTDIEEKQVNLNGRKSYILNCVSETEHDVSGEKVTRQLNVTYVTFLGEGNNVYILIMSVVDKYYEDFKEMFDVMTKSFMLE